MSIFCLTRSLSLIDIVDILSLVYLLLRVRASWLYWVPKLHKIPFKSCFIASSSSCSTNELSIILTCSLTAIINNVIKYCATVFERNGKIYFWLIKNSGEILSIFINYMITLKNLIQEKGHTFKINNVSAVFLP